MNQPLVTVYISTYNRVDLLKRAVESVRNQTYENLEIIIVDDCSTDNTHQYLSKIIKLDNRVKYFIKDENSGACVSRNIAIKNATGDYITGLDDDDYFLEDRIEFFLKNIDLLNKYEFIFSSVIYEKNGIQRKQGSIRLEKVKFEDLIYMNHIGNQIFCKTELLKLSHGFKEDLSAWQDWFCWMNILKNGGVAIFLEGYNYVLDDNDHVRITNVNKKEKIKKVFNIFVESFGLSPFDKRILSVNMIPYDIEVNIYRVFLLNGYKILNLFKLWYWKRIFNIFRYFIIK